MPASELSNPAYVNFTTEGDAVVLSGSVFVDFTTEPAVIDPTLGAPAYVDFTTFGLPEISGELVNHNQSVSGTIETTGITPGWQSVTLAAPLADPEYRITAVPDLAAGDVVWWDAQGGNVEVFTDASFSTEEGVTSFDVTVFSGGDEGVQGTQTIEEVAIDDSNISGSLTNQNQSSSGSLTFTPFIPVDVVLSGAVTNPLQDISGDINLVNIPRDVEISGVIEGLNQSIAGTVEFDPLEPIDVPVSETLKRPLWVGIRSGFFRR